MKKKVLTLICTILCCVSGFSQRQQGVYLEAFGASTTVGIHYDTRFNEKTRWGGRIGIAYTNSSSQDFFDSAPEKTTGLTFPIAFNYLIGNKKHNLELGIGISYGIYSCKYNTNGYRVEETKNSVFGFVDVGYRYQANNGLILRIGLNPGTALGMHDELGEKDHGVDRAAVIYPYISIGYNF